MRQDSTDHVRSTNRVVYSTLRAGVVTISDSAGNSNQSQAKRVLPQVQAARYNRNHQGESCVTMVTESLAQYLYDSRSRMKGGKIPPGLTTTFQLPDLG